MLHRCPSTAGTPSRGHIPGGLPLWASTSLGTLLGGPQPQQIHSAAFGVTVWGYRSSWGCRGGLAPVLSVYKHRADGSMAASRGTGSPRPKWGERGGGVLVFSHLLRPRGRSEGWECPYTPQPTASPPPSPILYLKSLWEAEGGDVSEVLLRKCKCVIAGGGGLVHHPSGGSISN